MKISELLNDKTYFEEDFEVCGLCSDTRKLKKGELFFALHGSTENGEKYIKNALNLGAKCVICQNFEKKPNVLTVKNVFDVFTQCVDKFYNYPQKEVTLIGVTGTNGKTTVTHMIADVLTNSGKKAGIIGTLGAKWNLNQEEFGNTTPGYLDFVRILRQMVDDGIKCVVCEVSAHAIEQKRLGNILFDVGIFTNLSQDHLDYFKDIEQYGKVKKSFFENSCKNCVVNADTEIGMDLYIENQSKTLTYGIYNPADSFGINFERTGNGESFVANVLDEIYSVNTPFLGEFNRYNLLASILTCRLLGIKGKRLERAISKIKPVSGRFNVYKGEKTVIIDYAHTPDGLKNILIESRKLTDGKVICVFGCGGDRDKSKRKIMGEISQKYADITVLTEDNSRSENIYDIISDILQGMTYVPPVFYSRTMAIEYAVKKAQKGDIVLIAGKGGEKYIEKEGKKISYSDEDEVKRILFT